ncbi:MAG TPA: hypothetical protein VNF72_11495 [Myxococcota bacterium]|jgi:hypothetical protein|nr:hypothetical protein [Myxococcota bacterium]
MTLQDLGSIGEIVGAIATVATLIYLAIQIRANTSAVQSAAAQSSGGRARCRARSGAARSSS